MSDSRTGIVFNERCGQGRMFSIIGSVYTCSRLQLFPSNVSGFTNGRGIGIICAA